MSRNQQDTLSIGASFADIPPLDAKLLVRAPAAAPTIIGGRHMAKVAPKKLSIEIRDCNSISSANITLRRKALNIKHGPNGVGKSTIANALKLRAEGAEALATLLPFKHRKMEGAPSPTVVGAESIEKVLVFNDEYVSQFVFRPDEVLKDSFEVFINTEEYKQGLSKIEALFQALKDTFTQQEEFDAALIAFTALRDAFGVTKGGCSRENQQRLQSDRRGQQACERSRAP